MSNFAMGKTVT